MEEGGQGWRRAAAAEVERRGGRGPGEEISNNNAGKRKAGHLW